MEAIFGTTLTRLEKLFCPTCDSKMENSLVNKAVGFKCKNYCCQNAECQQKSPDKPVCVFKQCKAQYGHNEPKLGVCNALKNHIILQTEKIQMQKC